MQKIPVYIINRTRAHERRRLMKEHLGALGIEHEFIEAVEGAELDAAHAARLNPAGNLAAGVLGCYLSHLRVYERMVAARAAVALVLEDDAAVSSSTKALLHRGCDSLDFDYCFLGADDSGDEGFVFYDEASAAQLGGGLTSYRLSSGPFCAHAYLLTLEAASKRLECAFPARAPIDHYRFLPYKPRFRAVIPMLAFVNEQHVVDSLTSSRWSAAQTRLHRHWWFFPLRDLLKLTPLRKRLFLRHGGIPAAGTWRSFPSAMRVVLPRRLAHRTG